MSLGVAAPAGRPRRRISAAARFTANPMTVVGLVVLGGLGLVMALAPVLPLADPDATDLDRYLLPPLSDGAVLGTDQFGRDLLSRLIWGARVSLGVGLAATLAAGIVGAAIGLLAAYYGRLVDTLLMRSIDTLMAFPYLLLALAIVAALGPGLLNALMAIAIVNVPFFARAVRGQALSIKSLDYIAAARLSGYSDARIILTELLPNVFPVIVVTMATTLSWMILETAGLSFLGLGAQPPTADLGSMLGNGRELIHPAPWVAVLPGVVIFLLAVGINLVSDGVRDLLDPRLKSGVLVRPAPRTARRLPEPPGAPADLPADTVLSVRHLSTCFELRGRVLRAVDDVSFDIARGEALGLVGESGSGKSVTALSITGLVASPPGVTTAGAVWLATGSDGPIDLLRIDLARLQAVRGGRIAYIFQDPLSALNPVLKVGEQVAETLRRHAGMTGAAARREAVRLFDAVRLPAAGQKAAAFPHELSGGQRQRVMIAMALANRPDLLIADEPTTALDVTTQKQVLALLNELRRDTGTALLFISHDFGVVADLCDRVAVMYAGRIVEQGAAAEVFGRPAHPYTDRLLHCIPDLARQRRIEPIPGLPPAVDDLPAGCHFAPRCALVIDACRQPQALSGLHGTHRVRCCRAVSGDRPHHA